MKTKRNKQKEFNILICGTGGQGLITLLQIIAQAALIEGYDVRTSELHGLSQRGGSVEVHIRFGKKIYSPIIRAGKADLILGLEMQEGLKAVNFAGLQTEFLLNQNIIPVPSAKNLTEEQILKNLKKISNNVKLIPAEKICQEKLGHSVVSGVYLVSLASRASKGSEGGRRNKVSSTSFKKIIPLKPSSVLRAIKQVIPKKYLDLNIKAFKLSRNH